MINVVIPMAGEAKRYTKSNIIKPYNIIENLPMFLLSIKNLPKDLRYIFIMKKEHIKKYSHVIKNIENEIKNFVIIEQEKKLNGPVATTMLAKKYINSKDSVLFVDSDQYTEWNINEIYNNHKDGFVVTTKSNNPEFSYVEFNKNIIKIHEKKIIGNQACAGLYFWSHGSDYINNAQKLILKDLKINNEFYISQVYNVAISNGLIFDVISSKIFTPLDK
jgi:NDP-sugar pyrophosphorylase family protein